MFYGKPTTNRLSRFLEEIPEEHLNWTGKDLEAGGSFGGSSTGSFGGAYGRGSYGSVPRSAGTYSDTTSSRPVRSGFQDARRTSVQPAAASSVPMLALDEGDLVEHRAFGRGKVLAVLPPDGRGDVEAHIDFENAGIKKMMLKMASKHLKKVEEA